MRYKKTAPEPVSVEDSPEPVSEEVHLPPPPEPEAVPVPEPPPAPVSVSQNEDEEPRLTRREVGEMIQSQPPSPKYHYINGMYIKIK
jgi:hypothetical protein